MSELLEELRLSAWAIYGAVLGVSLAIALVIRAIRRRSRGQVIYTVDERGRARTLDDATPPALEPSRTPIIKHSAILGDSGDDLGRDALAPLEGVDSDEAQEDSWGRARPTCPCCGCATGGAPEGPATCALCDWSGPENQVPDNWVDPVVAWGRSNIPAAELAAARARYRETGTALTIEDQKTWAGTPTAAERALRERLQRRFEYLARDPPDRSETWEAIDQLMKALAAARLARLTEPAERGDDEPSHGDT